MMGMGEEVWLKTHQDASCRLYGCPDLGLVVLALEGVEGASQAMFCHRHAQQVTQRELLIGGVVPPPRTPPG